MARTNRVFEEMRESLRRCSHGDIERTGVARLAASYSLPVAMERVGGRSVLYRMRPNVLGVPLCSARGEGERYTKCEAAGQQLHFHSRRKIRSLCYYYYYCCFTKPAQRVIGAYRSAQFGGQGLPWPGLAASLTAGVRKPTGTPVLTGASVQRQGGSTR